MRRAAKVDCCMAVVSHMPFDARVWKEAQSLAGAGRSVKVIGMRYGLDRANRTVTGRIETVEIPFGARREAGAIGRLGVRVLALLRLWLEVLRTPASVYHCHNIHPAPAVLAAAWVRRARVVYDAHELYGEPERGAGRAQRLGARIARLAEAIIARRAGAVITTNESRAEVLGRRHHLELVTVLRNVPPVSEATPADLGVGEGRSILLYQGGIKARARAFESAIAALRDLPDFDFVIIGFGRDDDLEQLRRWASSYGVSERVHLQGPRPFAELIGTAAAATVGLVPLREISTNSLLGDTNKMFEYLMGGLPVVGSDFPEIRRVLLAGAPPVGEVFDPEDPASIADAVRAVVAGGYDERRAEARRHALELHNWDLEQERLLALYER